MIDPNAILLPAGKTADAVPISALAAADWDELQKHLKPREREWLSATGFKGDTGQIALLPGEKGGVSRVFFGLGDGGGRADPFAFGRLARALPERTYRTDGSLPDGRLAALAWLLEAYRFDAYRKAGPPAARLVSPPEVDRDQILAAAAAHYLVRDLVNTPSSDMGPEDLEKASRRIAEAHNAKLRTVEGRNLEKGFPMVAAVGRASTRPPRLIDFSWGRERNPKVTIVGKGVCFDTGGLDIKPSAGMLLMKKDMGGAAHALALADLIMKAKLPVRLRVIIPAVENAISGNAFRPGDVLRSRKGITVEIGNTDAEGRLILADALALGDEESPDLMVDFATLTGAARIALGPDLPPFYTGDDAFAGTIAKHAKAESDPLWRMPLWDPYYSMIESGVADINNAGEGGFGGSITAALFLKRFVERAATYVHLDVFAWTPAAKPGRPKGGEAQGVRALCAAIRERYDR
jgi:leucyl aminopeptidase